MSTREDDRKRRKAHADGLMPGTAGAGRVLADGKALEAHEVEIDALARIEEGAQSAWDVLAAEALAERCFARGCAIAEGDIGSCPGWCALAIRGFEGWVMAS